MHIIQYTCSTEFYTTRNHYCTYSNLSSRNSKRRHRCALRRIIKGCVFASPHLHLIICHHFPSRSPKHSNTFNYYYPYSRQLNSSNFFILHIAPMASSTRSRINYSPGQTVVGLSGRKFKITDKISAGGYGAVFKVEAQDGGRYALKEEVREPLRDHFKLVMEVQIMEAAARQEAHMRSKHLPTLIDRSPPNKERMFIVMSLLGESLADVKRRRTDRVFSLNTGLYCAIECLAGIRDLHAIGYVHRDLKPANFVIGLPGRQNHNIVHLLDFGIARKFISPDGSVMTPRPKIRFKGTVRFAPLATHRQEELGRKDDCESWVYTLIDMIDRDRLPWHDVEDRRRVQEMKTNAIASPNTLFPNEQQNEFRLIVKYLADQHYVHELDYKWMRDMVRRVALRNRCSLEPPFDWHYDASRTL